MHERFRAVSTDSPAINETYPTLNEALRAAMEGGKHDVWLHDEHCNSTTRVYSEECPCKPIRIHKGEPE